MTIRIPLTPSGAWKELSPDVVALFEVKGLTWATPTHFFLAHRYFFDQEHLEAIRLATSPAEARAMALAPSPYDRDKKKMGTPEDPHCYWGWVRFNVIRRAIHERAMRDPSFVERLLATAQEPLVLESDDLVLGQVENGWGRLLVEMRARLSRESVDTLARWMLPRWLKYRPCLSIRPWGGREPLTPAPLPGERGVQALRISPLSPPRPRERGPGGEGLSAPWTNRRARPQYPEIAACSIGWRMGYGESYVYEFSEWLEVLPGAEQERFNAAYGAKCPADSDLHRDSSSAT